MLCAFQAFLVDNFYRVPRGPCRQLASKQASQRQKIHKPTAGHSSLPSVAVLLQLYHSRCFRLLQKSFLEHLSSKGRKIGGRSSVSMVALNWMMRVLQQDNARLKSCCLFLFWKQKVSRCKAVKPIEGLWVVWGHWLHRGRGIPKWSPIYCGVQGVQWLPRKSFFEFMA